MILHICILLVTTNNISLSVFDIYCTTIKYHLKNWTRDRGEFGLQLFIVKGALTPSPKVNSD